MRLLLIRHANAGDHDPSQWPDDRDRPLTDKGRKTHRRVSRLLGKLDLVPGLVLTSPWIRAAQTAAIVVETLALPDPPVPCDALATEPDVTRLAEFTSGAAPDATVAMVGHSPWMEELAAMLLGGSSTAVDIDFPKSGVLGIELDQMEEGAGQLLFFIRPKMAK
jgi:phosphohistidine phosphatase